MSRYRKIDPRIWQDLKFKGLNMKAQYIFVYLLSSPHSTAWGAYVLPDLYIQADTGFTQADIKKAVSELLANRLILRCEQTQLVCFPKWYKYNLPPNEKSRLACLRGVLSLPQCPVLTEFINSSEWVRKELANSSLTPPERLVDEQEQEQEQEQEEKKTKFDPVAVQPDWISDKDWSDLIEHRRLKKAAESQRAYTALVNQIKKAVQAGHRVEDVIDTICQRGWVGFQAEWMENKQKQRGKVKAMTPRQGYMQELGEGLEALDQIEGINADITNQNGSSGTVPALESLS